MLNETAKAMSQEFVEKITVDVTKDKLPENKIRIFMAGDSTCSPYAWSGGDNRYPRAGWGQVFGELFDEDRAVVVNCALSGRSAKSFMKEKNHSFLKENIMIGDYLFIQFAHNDCKKEDPSRYSTPEDGSYQRLITELADTARRVGAMPVFCTSITRNLPEDHTLEPYADALRALAKAEQIPIIDLYAITHKMLIEDGAERHGRLHMNLAPRDERFINDERFKTSMYYDEGCRDNTHLNVNGAREIARIAARELKRLNHPLAAYLNETLIKYCAQ